MSQDVAKILFMRGRGGYFCKSNFCLSFQKSLECIRDKKAVKVDIDYLDFDLIFYILSLS